MSKSQGNHRTHTILQPADCKCDGSRNCNICDGGLSFCTVCKGGEIELEEQTCEERQKQREQERETASDCSSVIAALFVDPTGVYSTFNDGRRQIDLWGEDRDARLYRGPHPVVAHPPCQRWGKFWHGSTAKPHQFRLGEDGGCFAAALTAVRNYGGVLEHPAYSKAWAYFGLDFPRLAGGWSKADSFGGMTCNVEQGHYGHMSRKATWLYGVGIDFADLEWGKSEQRLHPVALARYGYEKARRIGMMAMIGGKDKTKIRNATPPKFRDVLVSMIR